MNISHHGFVSLVNFVNEKYVSQKKGVYRLFFEKKKDIRYL